MSPAVASPIALLIAIGISLTTRINVGVVAMVSGFATVTGPATRFELDGALLMPDHSYLQLICQ